MESFCSSKNSIKRVKKARSEWEKMLLQKPTKNSYRAVKNTLKSFLKISKKLEQAFDRRGYPKG